MTDIEILYFLKNNKNKDDFIDVTEVFNNTKDAWDIFQTLNKDGYIVFKPYFPVTVEVLKEINKPHKAKITMKGKMHLQSIEKISIDLKISERVYKTYPTTRFITWAGFSISVLLLLLKLAEAIKLWPYHK